MEHFIEKNFYAFEDVCKYLSQMDILNLLRALNTQNPSLIKIGQEVDYIRHHNHSSTRDKFHAWLEHKKIKKVDEKVVDMFFKLRDLWEWTTDAKNMRVLSKSDWTYKEHEKELKKYGEMNQEFCESDKEDLIEPKKEKDGNTVIINQKNKNSIKIDTHYFDYYTRDELIKVGTIFGMAYSKNETKSNIAEDVKLYLEHDLWNFFTVTLDLEKVKDIIDQSNDFRPLFKKKLGWFDLSLYKQVMAFTTFVFMNHLLKIDNQEWFKKHVFKKTCQEQVSDIDFDFLVVDLKD